MRAHRVLIPTPALMGLILLAAGLSAAQAQAQPLPEPARVLPTSAVSLKQSFAPVVRRAAPAVVNAVVDALREFDIGHLDMPLTSAKIWLALQSKAGPGKPI